jgi:hypothetical protein
VGIGSVSAVLSCIVFAQKTMRQNPGSIYFIAYNLSSLLLLFVALFPLVLSNIVSYSLFSYNVPYCKLYFYGTVVFSMLSRYYLVLTSVNRALVTSSNALTRQRNTHRLAYWSIAGVTLIILLFCSHLHVRVDIHEVDPGYSICYYQPSNCQFAVILLVEIIIFFLFSAATLIFGIYLQITQYQTKNSQQQTFEQFLQILFYLFTFVPGAITFYVNLAVSKAFRQKTTEVLFKLCQHRPVRGGRRQGITGAVITNRTVIQ